MRKMNRPPLFRAHKWLNKAVRTFPKCKEPVGDGAKRVTAASDISEDCTHSSRISPMKQLILCVGFLLSALVGPSLVSPSQAAEKTPPKEEAPAKTEPPVYVQVTTSQGSFTIELNAERAPLTVAQFLKYVDQGYYSGTIFHRAIPNFIIQGGGYDPDYKLKGTPAKIVNE